ncbi:MAG: DNA polymerase III subunit gamma and tau [Actinomycetaceae bacterium]|nr:DNA polymerase III subunit gamma and tau [Actinomycetaceae bacterium]
MSTALYRRYRPDTFCELVGQDHVVAPLMAALRGGKVTHAYLFSGPRGCGKTTSARIMARCLNCQEGPTDTPCGQCPSCCDLATGASGSLDVVEIDAASHNGVDDARELRERATFAPVRDRYKIFILDEAHMVTPQGFNALLKLVEEPPDHVKFIFATTEPDKVISTIRSRTHHYPFRLVPPDILVKYLQTICERESISAGSGVLPLVVRAGGGSVRDSLSVLDQLMAGTEQKELDYRQCVALLGYTDATLLDDTVDALAGKDAAAVFAIIKRMVDSGHDPRRFVEDLLQRLRDLVIVSLAGREAAAAALHGTPDDQLERMYVQAQAWGGQELSQAADATHEALNSMQGATSPRLQVELLVARLLLIGANQAPQTQVGAGRGSRNTLGTYDVPQPLPVQTVAYESAPLTAGSDTVSRTDDSAHPDNPQAIREALAKKRAKREGTDEAVISAEDTVNANESVTRKYDERTSTYSDGTASSEVVEQSSRRQDDSSDTSMLLSADNSVASPGSTKTGGDASQMIRHKWDDVLATLKNMSKAVWFRAQTCQVGAVDAGILYIIFSGQGMANAFAQPDYVEALTKAIYEVVGLQVTVRPVTADQIPVGAGLTPQASPGETPQKVEGPTVVGNSEIVDVPGVYDSQSVDSETDNDDADSLEPRGSVLSEEMSASDDVEAPNEKARIDAIPPAYTGRGSSEAIASVNSSVPEDNSPSKDRSTLKVPSASEEIAIAEQQSPLASASSRSDVDEQAQAFFRQFAQDQQAHQQSESISPSLAQPDNVQPDNATFNKDHPDTQPPHNKTPDKTGTEEALRSTSAPSASAPQPHTRHSAPHISEQPDQTSFVKSYQLDPSIGTSAQTNTREEQPEDDVDEAAFDDEIISDSEGDDTFIAAGVARIEEILGATIIKETPLK